jgi:hypothetical protein
VICKRVSKESWHCFNCNFLSIFIGIRKKLGSNERRVWRYQRVITNPYIEEEQTTQWPKEKVQKDKQRYTKHTYKTKDRVTRTPLKTGGEHVTGDIRHVNLVANSVIIMNEERTWKCLRQVEHIRDHLWHRYSTAVN